MNTSAVTKALAIGLAVLIALPLYLMIGGGLFAYSVVSSTDQRHGIDVTASRRPGCQEVSEISSLQSNKRATIRLQGNPQVYFADVCINDAGVNMVVTHNVSHVLLTWNQAADLNLKPNRLIFDQEVKVGTSTKKAARVVLKSVKIGSIVVENVDALVARDYEQGYGIVGLSLLSRLKSSGVDYGRRMVLVAR